MKHVSSSFKMPVVGSAHTMVLLASTKIVQKSLVKSISSTIFSGIIISRLSIPYNISYLSVKTISNYVNHVFDTELDHVFKAREWTGYKVTRDFINFFRKS